MRLPISTPRAESTALLVVEDDDTIAAPLVEGLELEGFTPTRVRTGAEAVTAAEVADFVLLDLGLPDLDGGEVCRRIRARTNVPIIVVTAREDEVDRVRLLTLDAGRIVSDGPTATRRTGLAPLAGDSRLDLDDLGAVVINIARAEAWRSGAHAWTNDQRRRFANDLDSPQLIAVTAATNRSKSDRDPARWQPPNRDAWCTYATSWVTVKITWSLTADDAEVRALRNMLAGC